MITFATFDPATVSIWRDISFLRDHPEQDLLNRTFNAAFDGKGSDVKEIVDSADPAQKLLCFDVAGAVWHEKRHYVDMMLTNYGSQRRRLFFEIFPLIHACIEEAKELGELLLPIDLYANPVARRILGIKSSAPGIDQAARTVARRKKFFSDENYIFPELGRAVGGDAMIESLGAMCEELNQHAIFGTEAFEAWLVARKYSARQNPMYNLSRFLPSNLLPEIVPGKVVNIVFATALFYASLMGRTWGRVDDPTVKMSTGRPSLRLDRLITEFEGKLPAKISTEGAWELVNEACRRIWGRTAVEELDLDCEAEEMFIEGMDPNSDVGELARDIYSVRLKLVGHFKRSPELFLSFVQSAEILLPIISPPLIEFDPTGPAEHKKRNHVYRGANDLWPGGFTWASVRGDMTEAYLSVNRHYVPLARLFLNGQRENLRAGGELDLADLTLRMSGVQVRYAASHSVPNDIDETEMFFRLAPSAGRPCRFCSRLIQAKEGRLLSTYNVRGSPVVRQKAAERLGGKYTGVLELFRDWSPWLACSQCLQEFGNVDTPQLHPLKQFYEDGELLVSISPGDQVWSPGEKSETSAHNPGTSGPVRKPARKKPGRNEPCTCGSGLKFKKCCGRPI